MRFEEVYLGWQGHRLTQEEAAKVISGFSGTLTPTPIVYQRAGAALFEA